MTPQPGKFLVSFALGERAVTASQLIDLSPALLEAINSAPRYAEGTGVRIEVSRKSQVRDLSILAEIKFKN
jgi:hypothetical protein